MTISTTNNNMSTEISSSTTISPSPSITPSPAVYNLRCFTDINGEQIEILTGEIFTISSSYKTLIFKNSDYSISSDYPITITLNGKTKNNTENEYVNVTNFKEFGQVKFDFKKASGNQTLQFRIQQNITTGKSYNFILRLKTTDEYFDSERVIIGGDNRTNVWDSNSLGGEYLSILSSNGTVSQIENIAKENPVAPKSSLIISSPEDNNTEYDSGYYSLFISDSLGYISNLTPFNNVDDNSPIYLKRDEKRGNVLCIENATEHNRGVVRPDGSILKVNSYGLLYVDENNLPKSTTDRFGLIKFNDTYFKLDADNKLVINDRYLNENYVTNTVHNDLVKIIEKMQKNIDSSNKTILSNTNDINGLNEKVKALQELVDNATTYMVSFNINYDYITNDSSMLKDDIITLTSVELFNSAQESIKTISFNINFNPVQTSYILGHYTSSTEFFSVFPNSSDVSFNDVRYVKYNFINNIYNFRGQQTYIYVGNTLINTSIYNNTLTTDYIDFYSYNVINRNMKLPDLKYEYYNDTALLTPQCEIYTNLSFSSVNMIYQYSSGSPVISNPTEANFEGWTKLTYNFITDNNAEKYLSVVDYNIGKNIYVYPSKNLGNLKCDTNSGYIFCYINSKVSLYTQELVTYFSTVYQEGYEHNYEAVQNYKTIPELLYVTKYEAPNTTPEPTPTVNILEEIEYRRINFDPSYNNITVEQYKDPIKFYINYPKEVNIKVKSKNNLTVPSIEDLSGAGGYLSVYGISAGKDEIEIYSSNYPNIPHKIIQVDVVDLRGIDNTVNPSVTSSSVPNTEIINTETNNEVNNSVSTSVNEVNNSVSTSVKTT